MTEVALLIPHYSYYYRYLMFQKHTHRRYLLGVEEGANVDDSIRLIGQRMIGARRWSDFDARFQGEETDV